MRCRYNQRAQESAPFELLIAVILMGFVLFAGYQAISRLQEQTCANTINAQLEGMSRNLQNVATGKGTAQFSFLFGECSAKINDCENFSTLSQSTDVECVRLLDSTDPNICSSFCSSARSICTLLQYKSTRDTITKCVEISPSTDFPAEDSQQCPSRQEDGWFLQPLDETTIQQGTYSLLKVSDLTASVPIVCAYLKGKKPLEEEP
ncbi:MAG: hypothetical protein AABW68_03120 [archaeon]